MNMCRSVLTLLLLLPFVFSRGLDKSKKIRRRRRNLKAAKKDSPVYEELSIESDPFFDINMGIAPLALLDWIGFTDVPYGEIPGLPIGISGTTFTDQGDVVTEGDTDTHYYTSECTLVEADFLTLLFDAMGMPPPEASLAGATPALQAAAAPAAAAAPVQTMTMQQMMQMLPPEIPIPGKLGCNIDICLGIDESGDRNCVYLRFSGLVESVFLTVGLFQMPPRLWVSQPPIQATVIGGTGRFRGSTGEAIIVQSPDFETGTIILATIPSHSMDDLWEDYEFD